MVRCAEVSDASGTVEIMTDTKAVPCYERHVDIKLSQIAQSKSADKRKGEI